jgi:hypothetical protein
MGRSTTSNALVFCAIAAIAVLGIAACSGSASSIDTKPSSPPSQATASSKPSAFAANREVEGHTKDGTLWALFYHRHSGQPVKTLWRITGRGGFSVYAADPDGEVIRPKWGPEPHAGSSWG